MAVSKVYFTRDLSSESVLRLYQLVGKKLKGRIAIKLHSGEEGNQNYLRPEFWKPVIDHIGGTVVECNTAYDGERNYTTKHMKLIRKHGWNRYFPVDLMDAEGPVARSGLGAGAWRVVWTRPPSEGPSHPM